MQYGSIDQIVAALRRRKRTLNAVSFGLRGLFVGCLLAVLAVLASFMFRDLTSSQQFWLLLTAPVAAAIGFIAGLACPIDSFRLARALDHAAGSEDRFTSALQLSGHRRRQRVSLITRDALAAVAGADARQVLPMTYPREFRWVPLVLCLFLVCVFWRPVRSVTAVAAGPEVSAEQWQQLQAEFRRQVERELPGGLPEDNEAFQQLARLASSLSRQPDKKAVLAEVARLRSNLNSQRAQLPTRDVNLRRAAQALSSSEQLRQLAELLRQGRYSEAAGELKRLAAETRAGKLNLSAEQLEAMAADFQRLAEHLQPPSDLHQACQQCASAASSFDLERLAESLDELCKRLDQNADSLQQNDAYCRACDALDDFERRLAQTTADQRCSVCQGKNSENCAACQGSQKSGQHFVQSQGPKKSGLKAGKGTSENWLGGKLDDREARRIPDVVADQQRGGPQTVVSQSISKDEKADSNLKFKEKFAEFVQQSEADLELENIPLALRDYLRRYFAAIKPDEDSKDVPDHEPELK